MGLKERYLEAVTKAAATTYLKDVGGQLPYTPDKQNESGGVVARGGSGVNFFDGTKRPSTDSTDLFQTEFTRNLPGANRIGGAQAPVLADSEAGKNNLFGTKTNTRWKNKALELAFDGTTGGPNTFTQGSYWNTNTFRVARVGESTRNLHNYIPSNVYTAAPTGGYINKFDIARTRYNASSTSR